LRQTIDIQNNRIRKTQNNHDNALLWLFYEYMKAVFDICFRMTGNKNDTEDVLQGSFIIALKNFNRVKTVNQSGEWLRKIVVNECIGYCKKCYPWVLATLVTGLIIIAEYYLIDI
jgi:RNA polymerase sigma-70 factor (ECF subfamily)